jgi:hypothetical protein
MRYIIAIVALSAVAQTGSMLPTRNTVVELPASRAELHLSQQCS